MDILISEKLLTDGNLRKNYPVNIAIYEEEIYFSYDEELEEALHQIGYSIEVEMGDCFLNYYNDPSEILSLKKYVLLNRDGFFFKLNYYWYND